MWSLNYFTAISSRLYICCICVPMCVCASMCVVCLWVKQVHFKIVFEMKSNKKQQQQQTNKNNKKI